MGKNLNICMIPVVLISATAVSLPGPCSASPKAASQDTVSLDDAEKPARDEIADHRILHAVRTTNGGIKLDGILDESDWQGAPVASNFTQLEPHEGEPATEETAVRVLYDDEYIYVGVHAYDSDPDLISGRLCRRDGDAPSDWIVVGFDSYNDERTGYGFSVNPCGVKQDRIWYNDSEEDMNWDAVWDVATNIDSTGWTAEFKIPFSQLRYSNNGANQSWGFQVAREINRKNETSLWRPMYRDANQVVSLFGDLHGLENIPKSRRLEILPYVVSSVEQYGDPEDDPFLQDPYNEYRIGGDLKYGLTSNMTLDMTINPDFGQVEQDPSEFNLTAYEIYFEEKRPFFIEGANLFQYRLFFGDDSREGLFYSRRIGRSPQFDFYDSERFIDTDDFYDFTPRFTTILAAAKVTGRASGGWSVAVLDALTDKAEAIVESPTGNRYGVAVEPLTNYFAARTMKDYNAGRSTIGGMVTSVTRDIPNGDLEYLNRQAFTGGADFTHRWGGDDYSITARVMGSHLRGSEEAMIEIQTSSARYFQRPDATHLEVDSTATHLSGLAGTLWLGKFAGGHWRWGLGYVTRSPAFEANDIGFMQNADMNLAVFWGGYRQFEPGRIFREWNVNLNLWDGWNYGGDNFGLGGNVNGYAQFANYWGMYAGVNREQPHKNNSILRGGPSMLVPGALWIWYGGHSDNRKSISFGYDGNYGRDDLGFRTIWIGPSLTLRPSGRFDLMLRPAYMHMLNDRQYVDEIDSQYILARIDYTEFSVTTRLNFTMSPNMTFQFYGMPYIAAGKYSYFKNVVRPHAPEYDDRFEPFDYSPYENPDFNFKQLRTNLVFRWEYSPGSTLYLVWSRGATNFEEEYGEFDLGRDWDMLMSSAGNNTFLLKFNYWISL